MPDHSTYYCDLVATLLHMHAHQHHPKHRFEVQKRVSNELDFDEVHQLIEEAAERLDFLTHERDRIWLHQTRALLEFLHEECGVELWTIAPRLGHLKPPSLRDEFDLPPRY